MVKTRPEIAFAVFQCSHFLSNHTEEHDQAALRILGYLSKFPDYGIIFRKPVNPSTEPLDVRVYVDASWADVKDDRTSSYGYVAVVNDCSIAWKSKRTPDVCLSSCESEYNALCEGSREAAFLTNLLNELKVDYISPLKIFSDSQPAIAIATIPRVNQRTKHIDTRYQYSHKLVQLGKSDLQYVESELNIADIFTKPLGKVKFDALRSKLIASVH